MGWGRFSGGPLRRSSGPCSPGLPIRVATGILDRLTRLRKSSVIYLRGSQGDGSADPLVQLLNAQEALDVPVYLVPIAVTYGPRREKKERPLVDIFFGDQENPGWLRRLIAFFRYQNRTSVIVAEPVDLSLILKENGERAASDLAPGLRGELDRPDRSRKERGPGAPHQGPRRDHCHGAP